MITRMEITFRSKEPTKLEPQIFSPGSFRAVKDGIEFVFDFENTESGSRHEGGYLYMDCLLKNYDEDLDLPLEAADPIIRKLVKEDFLEVNYECYADMEETKPIELIPVDIAFYDYSATGDGKPIEVEGEGFLNLEDE